MRAIPEHLRDASCGAAIQIDYLYLYLWQSPKGFLSDILNTEKTPTVIRVRIYKQYLTREVTTIL